MMFIDLKRCFILFLRVSKIQRNYYLLLTHIKNFKLSTYKIFTINKQNNKLILVKFC